MTPRIDVIVAPIDGGAHAVQPHDGDGPVEKKLEKSLKYIKFPCASISLLTFLTPDKLCGPTVKLFS